jgi:hypothetical protein
MTILAQGCQDARNCNCGKLRRIAKKRANFGKSGGYVGVKDCVTTSLQPIEFFVL